MYWLHFPYLLRKRHFVLRMDAESLQGWVSPMTAYSEGRMLAAFNLGWGWEAPATLLEQGWGEWGDFVLRPAVCRDHLYSLESLSLFQCIGLGMRSRIWHFKNPWHCLSFICPCLYLLQWGTALLSPFFSYLMLPVAFLSVLVTLSETLSACAALSSWKLIIAIRVWSGCLFIFYHSIFRGSFE